MRASIRSGTLAAFALALAGCAVGPNFQTPAPRPEDGYGPLPSPSLSAPGAPTLALGAAIPRDWWRAFGDPALDALVEEALRNSPTLEAAKAALRQARETAAAQRGAFLPQIDAAYNPVRSRYAPDLASPLANGSSLYSLTTTQIEISYVPDLFGANRRAVENLAALQAVQRFELEAARVSLANNVVAAAIADASLRAQIAATQKMVADQRRLLAVLNRQFVLGQSSKSDLAAQRAELAQTEAAFAPLQRQLEVNRDLLVELLGRTPGDPPSAIFELAELRLPKTLPVSLPSDLVRQRPDVRAAAAALEAASAEVGVAVAARLPNVNLAATAGSATLALGTLSLADGARFWSLGATIAQPIFQGGALLHRQRAAEAGLDQAKAQYRQTVLSAFQNAADAMHALDRDLAQAAAAARARDAAEESLSIERRQLALGDLSLAALLTGEGTEAQAEITAVQARAAALTDVAALFQALGGGWWTGGGATPGGGR